MSRGRIVRLFNNCDGKFEDMGGKTDAMDNNEIDTAIREACEETNGKLFSKFHTNQECAQCLYRHIMKNSIAQYNCRSKYLLFKVYVNPSILSLNMNRFGLTEETDWGTLPHYYKWCRYIPRQLHVRLRGMRL